MGEALLRHKFQADPQLKHFLEKMVQSDSLVAVIGIVARGPFKTRSQSHDSTVTGQRRDSTTCTAEFEEVKSVRSTMVNQRRLPPDVVTTGCLEYCENAIILCTNAVAVTKARNATPHTCNMLLSEGCVVI